MYRGYAQDCISVGYNLALVSVVSEHFDISARLAVAQWIVHMPPKRGIQVRFLSEGPTQLESTFNFAIENNFSSMRKQDQK